MHDHQQMLWDIRSEAEACGTPVGERVMAAMARIPRERFVPQSLRGEAFRNGPLPIGQGQTISQPFIVALMSQLLDPRSGDTVLEVGTGSGYQAAILSGLAKRVISLEILPDLADQARQRLASLGIGNVEVILADGHAGWPAVAPYDGIMVTAAARDIPPALVAQLRAGARLVLPVGAPHGTQALHVLEKTPSGTVLDQVVLPVAFVPMTGRG